jgi:hypothetical protein
MRASYARVHFGQRQPSRSGDHPGAEARNCSGENVVAQRQQLRGAEWDSGRITQGSDMTRAYEHAFAPTNRRPVSTRRNDDGGSYLVGPEILIPEASCQP